jgi:hypothetical protein
LAMELKTSWVETTNLPHSENYVKVKATIPNYQQTSPGEWTRNGTRTADLALVGMHVVGSVKGHPEMIWSTFEHVNNTPNLDIDLLTGVTPSQFIFKDNSGATTNIPHISGFYDLAGANGFPISASNTQRNMNFGWAGLAPFNQNTNNPVDVLTQGLSDRQLRDLYSDARNRLLVDDVRRNYFLVGAMWNSPFNNPLLGAIDNHIAGTVRLSNATMETYTQANTADIGVTTTTGAGFSCFSCHNRGVDIYGDFEGAPPPRLKRISHVFGRPIAP